jgi:hypothetical protein
LRHDWKQDCRQNRDDRDDCKQFNECESVAFAGSIVFAKKSDWAVLISWFQDEILRPKWVLRPSVLKNNHGYRR